MPNALLRRLIAKGESQTLDFKYYISSAAKISKSLVAFANTDGGSLLIGVKDNGSIVGISSEEEIYMIELAAEQYCKPPVKVETLEWSDDGRVVLEVKVEPASVIHYSKDENGKWLAFFRKNDENILADPIMIEVRRNKLKNRNARIQFGAAETALLAYLKTNKSITHKEFVKIGKVPPYVAKRILVNMIGAGVLEIIHTAKGVVFSLSEES